MEQVISLESGMNIAMQRECSCAIRRKEGQPVTFTYCHLHAAAPELLSVVEALVEIWNAPPSDYPYIVGDVLKQARTAYMKATTGRKAGKQVQS